MTCCVLIAAIFGGLMSLKVFIFCTSLSVPSAQDWRLSGAKKTNE